MAGWLIHRIGYGKAVVIDPDNPENPPAITASITAPNYDTFTRLLQGQFYNTEEVRISRPTSFSNGSEYVGAAPTGSATSETIWKVVKCTWENYHKTRLQYREGISWDNKEFGW